MSFLTTDYNNLSDNNRDFEALPTGEYEMIILNAKEDATPSGAESFQIDLLVRNDLKNVPELAETNGKYYNRRLWNDNWKRKATKQYDLDNFQHFLKAAKVPEGTEINSIDDLAQKIIGKPVRVYVKKEVDDYNSTETETKYRNQVAPWNYSESKFPQVQHEYEQSKDPFEDRKSEEIDLSDEAFPF